MSTATVNATTPPAFPAPIPITYSWSTPNALRRLALPPLATTLTMSSAHAGPSRSRPVGGARRPLPRPPREERNQAQTQIRAEEFGRIPFPDPYAYQVPPPAQYQPVTSRQEQNQNYLVPLVQETNRLSFSEPQALHPPERGRSAQKLDKQEENKKKNGGVERRISVSGIVARFRKRSRSRSISRDGTRNLLDDE